MSTTSPTTTGTSLAETSVPVGGGGGGGGFATQQGANYFFGFLITFVVLLFVFVGCGFVRRRRFVARRRAGLESGGDLRVFGYWEGRDVEPVEPAYVEPWLMKGIDSTAWQAMKPLSTAILRDTSKIEEKALSVLDQTSSSISILPNRSWTPIPRRFRKTPDSERADPTEKEPETKPPDPVEIQVAIMIAMPRHPEKDGANWPEEYEFGVSRLPYHEEAGTVPRNVS